MTQLKAITLGPEWLDKAVELRKNNKVDVDGLPLENTQYIESHLKNQYLTHTSKFYRAYGVIDENDKLWAYGFQKFFSSERAWALMLVISNQNEQNGMPLNGLGLVLDEMIKYAESVKCYRYYTATPLARASQHDAVWSRISSMKKDRYVSCLEETIPANTLSAFSQYWENILGQYVFQHDMAIRQVFLLPEYRSF